MLLLSLIALIYQENTAIISQLNRAFIYVATKILNNFIL